MHKILTLREYRPDNDTSSNSRDRIYHENVSAQSPTILTAFARVGPLERVRLGNKATNEKSCFQSNSVCDKNIFKIWVDLRTKKS